MEEKAAVLPITFELTKLDKKQQYHRHPFVDMHQTMFTTAPAAQQEQSGFFLATPRMC